MVQYGTIRYNQQGLPLKQQTRENTLNVTLKSLKIIFLRPFSTPGFERIHIILLDHHIGLTCSSL